jgi:hypothetical protein
MPDQMMPMTDLDAGALDALAHGRHGNPFALLGLHPDGQANVVRTCLPNAATVEVLARSDRRVLATLELIHPAGVFAGAIGRAEPYLLRITWPSGVVEETEDPYTFGLVLTEDDLRGVAGGDPEAVRQALGSRPTVMDGVAGTRFTVWAPNARRVSVVGEFNSWDGRRHPMRLRHHGGIWELFIPRVADGALYKYEVLDRNGQVPPQRADPMARETELPPRTASVVPSPFPGMGFTHVELMPISEHPVRRLVGLPAARAVRAHRALRPAGGLRPLRRRLPRRRCWRAGRLGARRISPADAHGLRGSTAPRCTSMPIRARASTRTGTPDLQSRPQRGAAS